MSIKRYIQLYVFLVLALLVLASPVEAETQKFGIPEQIGCYNCTPFSAKVKVSNYDPNRGPINCWDYDEKIEYCKSPTWIGVPWEAVWAFGAACPADWPIGTWVDIDTVGYFICFDHGDAIVCKDGICNVDILGPSDVWNGKEFDATLWVPRSYLIRLSEAK